MSGLEELKHLLTQHTHLLRAGICKCEVPVGSLPQDWADHVALKLLTEGYRKT